MALPPPRPGVLPIVPIFVPNSLTPTEIKTIVGTAIPKITDEFHGLSQVSWYGSAYFMCLGGFQSSWGKAFRYFDLKWTFTLTVAIFELGSLICGVSPNANAFIVGRAIAGLGAAGASTGATVIFAFCVEPARRPTLMGLIGIAYTLAAIIGPLLGGAFSEHVTWRWCFYINLPIGIAAVLVILVFFHAPSIAKTIDATFREKLLHLDLIGVALTMGSVISFILALQYGGQSYAWDSSQVIGLLVGFVVITIALCIWQVYYGDYAMVPIRLFKRRALWASSLFQFCFAGCYFLLLYYLPLYFQSIKGKTATESGVANLPLVITGCIAIISGGIVVTKTRHAMPFMLLGAALTTVACGLFCTLDINTDAGKWIGYQILGGFAVAFAFQNALNVAHHGVSPEDISTVTSTLYCKCATTFILLSNYSSNIIKDSTDLDPRSLSSPWRSIQHLGRAISIRQCACIVHEDDCSDRRPRARIGDRCVSAPRSLFTSRSARYSRRLYARHTGNFRCCNWHGWPGVSLELPCSQ